LLSGQRVLEVSALALFSQRQYRTPGFPFVPFTPDLPLRWVTGRELPTGEPCAVPLNLVYTAIHRTAPNGTAPPGAYGDEPRTNPLPYAGLAAGTSREQAETNALLELIERDAIATSSLSGARWSEIIVPDALAELFGKKSDTLTVRLFHVPAVIRTPVVAALVEDPVTDFLALGTAARTDPTHAALKSVAEACQLHLMLTALDDPDSALMRLAATEPSCPLMPWRADRRYRDSYDRDDWRDVRDLACQLQLYLDPDIRALFRSRLRGLPTMQLNDLATSSRTTTALLDALRAIDIAPVSIDVTTTDVRAADWTVVRVVAPGLYPNTPAAFPTLGGTRVPHQAESSLPLPYA